MEYALFVNPDTLLVIKMPANSMIRNVSWLVTTAQVVKNAIKVIKSTEMENVNMLMNTAGSSPSKGIVLTAIDFTSLTHSKNVKLKTAIARPMPMGTVSSVMTSSTPTKDCVSPTPKAVWFKKTSKSVRNVKTATTWNMENALLISLSSHITRFKWISISSVDKLTVRKKKLNLSLLLERIARKT
jgi:hypothetical protein